MKIKLLIDIGGRFDEGEGIYKDVKRGDIVEVSDFAAQKYVKAGMGQLDLNAPPGRAFMTTAAGGSPAAGRSPYFNRSPEGWG